MLRNVASINFTLRLTYAAENYSESVAMFEQKWASLGNPEYFDGIPDEEFTQYWLDVLDEAAGWEKFALRDGEKLVKLIGRI